MMRTVVVGASSGLGRCIGVGLAQRGAQVALLARRRARLDDAVGEAGPGAVAIECDVVDAKSCASAMGEAAEKLVGTDAETWRRTFDTNVTGAALITTAALEHLVASHGTAVYLSSVSTSMTPPWPGLG